MKILITIPYWQGDYEQAEKLCSLIADLEKSRNHKADILLLGRYDAKPLSEKVVEALRDKFDTVHQVRCDRRGVGYPYGANELWYYCLSTFNSDKWKKTYFGWMNLEPDITPLRADWISRLHSEWMKAAQDGHWAMGLTLKDHPIPHLNGGAIYAMDLAAKLFGRNVPIGGPAQTAYDTFLGKRLLPKSLHNNGFFLSFKMPSIEQEELFCEKYKDVYLFHGVKDSSAIEAVRSEVLGDAGAIVPIDPDKQSPGVVFTYLDAIGTSGAEEQRRALKVFTESWNLRGWKVRVLNQSVAKNHPQYEKFLAKVESLPTVNTSLHVPSFMRWLALAEMGGGLFAEHDVLNAKLKRTQFSPEGKNIEVLDPLGLSVLVMGKQLLNKFVKFVLEEDLTPLYSSVNGAPHLSDGIVLKAFLATQGEFRSIDGTSVFGVARDGKSFRQFPLIHFSMQAAVAARKPKFLLMQEEALNHQR